MTPAPRYRRSLPRSLPSPAAPEPSPPAMEGTSFTAGTMVGRGVRVGKGVAVGGLRVAVCVDVLVGVLVGVQVTVGVGVEDGLSVGVAVADAVAVSVRGTGDGVRVGGLRVGVDDAIGVMVAAGWLVSGHRPTASRKIQS